MAWNPKDREIIDIGGSKLSLAFDDQLPKAFANKADFPKEVAYTAGMDKWAAIANQSYQTSDELEVIQATAAQVVAQLPNGTKIIDLGAANSRKYEPYVAEFIKQGKVCVYLPLDLNRESLVAQVNRAKDTFPTIRCVGILGSFQQGDKYFAQIPSGRLFLSLGSIFYNAPDQMCKDRCQEFARHLTPLDRLIIGQDGPSDTESAQSHASYGTKVYDDFFNRYLEGIQEHAGIDAVAKEAWSYESKMVKAMHYFEVVAQQKMICTKFGGYVVETGTIYTMFPSWKRGEEEIHLITKNEGLAIKTLGKAKNSGMRQYIVQSQ